MLSTSTFTTNDNELWKAKSFLPKYGTILIKIYCDKKTEKLPTSLLKKADKAIAEYHANHDRFLKSIADDYYHIYLDAWSDSGDITEAEFLKQFILTAIIVSKNSINYVYNPGSLFRGHFIDLSTLSNKKIDRIDLVDPDKDEALHNPIQLPKKQQRIIKIITYLFFLVLTIGIAFWVLTMLRNVQ